MHTYFSLTKSSPFVQFYSDFQLNLVRSKVPRISSLANPKLAASRGEADSKQGRKKANAIPEAEIAFRAAARKEEELIKLRALSLSLCA
jgi:hypothetical protein